MGAEQRRDLPGRPVRAGGALQARRPPRLRLILTDLHMPRMGGMDLLSQIKKRWGGPEHSCVPVVAVTADAFEETQQRCLAAGFSRCLAKPFRVEEFSKLLSKLGAGPNGSASS